MKKVLLITTLLTALVALSYSYFAGEDKSTMRKQVQENSQRPQPVQQSKLTPNRQEPNKVAQAQVLNIDNHAIVAQTPYVRAAPPPPMPAKKQRDGRYISAKSHGHEQVKSHEHEHGHSQDNNPPPPPTGAN